MMPAFGKNTMKTKTLIARITGKLITAMYLASLATKTLPYLGFKLNLYQKSIDILAYNKRKS